MKTVLLPISFTADVHSSCYLCDSVTAVTTQCHNVKVTSQRLVCRSDKSTRQFAFPWQFRVKHLAFAACRQPACNKSVHRAFQSLQHLKDVAKVVIV